MLVNIIAHFFFQQCAASQKKSVSGLDNVVADGLDGFDTLEQLTSNLHKCGEHMSCLNNNMNV